MVDATASFRDRAGAAARAFRHQVAVLSLEELGAYARLAEAGIHAPAQGALWIEEWVATTSPDGFIVLVETDGRPAWALALEIVRFGPFRVARFMGGRHANGNFPAADPAFLRSADFDATAIPAAIRAVRKDVDAVVLERLAPDLDGTPNPLLPLATFPSPNVSLAVSLAGGFDALLLRASGKRKRKKHRSQIRKFEAAGGFRRIQAATPEEVQRLLDGFFAMKEHRFRKMGIANVFAEAEVRTFFRALFRDALEESPPPFVLHGLEVGDELRAVTGSSRSGRRLVCEFGAIADDDLAHASPGDFLFFENISEACRDGMDVYDFSVGDEPYKRLWCDLETRHFDVAMPLTAKGRLLVAGLMLKARATSGIKNSPTIWKLAKMLRRRAAGQPQQDAD